MNSDMLFLFFGSSGAYEGRSDADAPSLGTPSGRGLFVKRIFGRRSVKSRAGLKNDFAALGRPGAIRIFKTLG